MKNKFRITNSVKYGTYSLISISILLAVIIILNLALGILPAKYTAITDNKEGIYDISNTSKRLLSSLKDGTAVAVNGYVKTDKFDGELALTPNAVMKIKKLG